MNVISFLLLVYSIYGFYIVIEMEFIVCKYNIILGIINIYYKYLVYISIYVIKNGYYF